MFLHIEHSVTNRPNTYHAIPVTPKQELKIVFVGNVGSGKTTSIHAISEKEVLSTEAKATESDALHRKTTTTVAMEYGVMYMQETKLHLYGTPGQRRFDFMAPILCKGAAGMIIMIDNGHNQPLTELDYFLTLHHEFLQRYSAVIAITHYDDNETNTHLVEYHQHIKSRQLSIPIMRVDAREKDQVQQLVRKLLNEINQRVLN